MKLKKTKKIIVEMAIKKADSDNKKANAGWPPLCAGIFHQPKRPIQKKVL